MIDIAICDDESQEIERTNELLIKYSKEHPQYTINIHLFSAPTDLLDYVVSKGRLDVILLDVYMPGFLGTNVARELRTMGDTCQIIFLTTSRDHAVDAFSLNAAHYLVKPYLEADLEAALDKALTFLLMKDRAITVKSTEGVIRINLNQLVYSEAENHFQRLNLSDGRTICVRKSSTELFELLDEDPRFFKCGSTYIINMDYVVELSSRTVAFSTGVILPMISRKYADFKQQYMDYICSR